jgi:hypothetical protein
MSDSWSSAARRLDEQRTAEESKRARNVTARAPQAQADPVEDAIDKAAEAMEAFIRERGAGARELLRAAGHKHIVFGARDGVYGDWSGIYFDELGFRDGAKPNHYVDEPHKGSRPTTAYWAVRYFAYGEAREDPSKIQGIVDWFRAQLDELANKS